MQQVRMGSTGSADGAEILSQLWQSAFLMENGILNRDEIWLPKVC